MPARLPDAPRGPGHPLVEPGPELTRDQVERYSRHLLLADVGRQGQRRLLNARVLVVGAGGLGCPAILYLAAAGVGTIGVIDDDLVDLSNLQRQVLHRVEDVGRPKVDSAADAVTRLNPEVTVRRHQARLTPENAAEITADYDLIIDGSDNLPTRYVSDDAAASTGIPLVWGSVLRFDGQASVFWAGHGPRYRDVFPTLPPPGTVPSCGEAGVIGAVVAAVGAVLGAETVKLILGVGKPLLGRLLVFDSLAMTWRSIPLAARAASAAATTPSGEAPAHAGSGPQVSGRVVTQEPAAMTAAELAEELASPTPPLLVDVRTGPEVEIVSIPGALHVVLDDVLAGRHDLDPHADIVLYCRGGVRSAQAWQAMHKAGFERIRHLEGGVLAWIESVDPSLPSY